MGPCLNAEYQVGEDLRSLVAPDFLLAQQTGATPI
jgi:hypothetical protein